jgi:hypothetical protein
MSDKSKQILYEKQADIAKAIAHPLRIALLIFSKTASNVFAILPSSSARNAQTFPDISQ